MKPREIKLVGGLLSLCREAKFLIYSCSLCVQDKKSFGHSKISRCRQFKNSKLRRVCCKILNLYRFLKSLSRSIDIERSIFIGLIDSLYRFLSSPSSHSCRNTSHPLTLFQSWFYNCSRNIYLLCLNKLLPL